jgi:hypothetical protein
LQNTILLALHAIRGYSLQSEQKGNRLPFTTGPKATVFEALSPLANYQRGNRAPHANSDKGKQTIFGNFKKFNFGRLSSYLIMFVLKRRSLSSTVKL